MSAIAQLEGACPEQGLTDAAAFMQDVQTYGRRWVVAVPGRSTTTMGMYVSKARRAVAEYLKWRASPETYRPPTPRAARVPEPKPFGTVPVRFGEFMLEVPLGGGRRAVLIGPDDLLADIDAARVKLIVDSVTRCQETRTPKLSGLEE